MRRVVVKLGSSVVADSDGEPRAEVLRNVCEALAGVHRSGGEVIVVTSGAIARGMSVMGLAQRPSSIRELQAASAVGQGKLYRIYDELLRERGVTSAQVLLTFFDMSARTHYLNARQTLITLLEWRVLPVINENDTTATDEISFGDNDFLAAQVAVLVGADELILLTDIDGLYTADPRLYPDAKIVREVDDFAGLARAGDRAHDLAAGLGRDALEGRRRRHGHSGRDRDCDLQRRACGGAAGGAGGRARGNSLRRARGTLQLVQALAEVRQALARDAARRRRRGARRARGERQPAAGRGGRGARRVRCRRRGGHRTGRQPRRREPVGAGKGICNYSATELRRVQGMKSTAAREVLPRASEEAVHRDYLVMD